MNAEPASAAAAPLLEVTDLRTSFAIGDNREVTAVDGVSFSVKPGETLAIVGESGSGKSVTSLSIMRLLPKKIGRITSGTIRLRGRDIAAISEHDMRRVRGKEIGMIFQEPMTSLNPVHTIGTQIAEMVIEHDKLPKAAAFARAVEMLEVVGIPEPRRRADNYPHQMSGGMRQRAMIAMALACRPTLLIADEPTTALDVTIQAQILDLMRSLKQQFGMAIVFITHDLGVVAEMADRVVVMYGGQIVESGTFREIFARPLMPYTAGLMRSIPRLGSSAHKERLHAIPGYVPMLTNLPSGCRFRTRCSYAIEACAITEPPLEANGNREVRCIRWRELDLSPRSKAVTGSALLNVAGLTKHFPIRGGVLNRVVNSVQAVNGVSFSVNRGEVVGLVGESGSGKTTVGRTLLRLEEPTAGVIEFDGTDITRLPSPQLRAYRKRMQIVFQDPYASLNPREKVRSMLLHALNLHNIGEPSSREGRAVELLERVGLTADYLTRYPHEFSGGQRQRLGIARALAVEPDFVVADEPVSALDVSIQAQVINLLEDLKETLGFTMLFIAHDLAVVEHISDRVIVMYLGRIMEIAPTRQLYSAPNHPYTRALMSAVPSPDPDQRHERVILKGDIPSPINPPSGCVFRTRCPIAIPDCAKVVPQPVEIGPGHFSACIRTAPGSGKVPAAAA